MKAPYEDDDNEARNDSILEHLLGEVDDYAGEGLPGDEDEKKEDGIPAAGGVEISIIVKPKGAEGEEKPEAEVAEGEEGEHDDIAHALGMHDGGCAY